MATIAKASQQLLLDAINRDNGLTANPLTLEQMGLGLPIPTGVDNAFYNTYCTVYGLYGKGFYGSVKLSYQRYEMEKMFRNITPILIVDPLPYRVSDLLPAFNAQYGLSIAATDIVDNVLVTTTNGGMTDITMVSSNWAWLGTLKVRYAKTLPYIADLLTNTSLDAITPVLPFTTKPRAEYVAYGYDFTGGYTMLTNSLASVGKVLSQDQFDALSVLSSLKLTLSVGVDVAAGEISIADAVWGGMIQANSSDDYNSDDYTYVNTLVMPSTSNYTGTLILHFNAPPPMGS